MEWKIEESIVTPPTPCESGNLSSLLKAGPSTWDFRQEKGVGEDVSS